jgi:precorrin-4 methylase
MVRSTENMEPEDMLQLMQEYYKKGLQIVRLLDGDPAHNPIFTKEKKLLEKADMRYHLTPGIK